MNSFRSQDLKSFSARDITSYGEAPVLEFRESGVAIHNLYTQVHYNLEW